MRASRLVSVLIVGVCLALTWPTRTARAQAEPGPSVSWTAPTECPDGAHVQDRIVTLLGKPKAGDARASVQATGVISHGRAGYKLVLSVKSPTGSGARTLLGADCAALSETAAWLVAVTIDENVPPEGNPPSEPPTPEPPPAPPPPVPVAPPPPVLAVEEPPRPSLWSVHGSIFGGLYAARPDDLRPQLGGSVGLGYDFLLLELRAAFALKDSQTIGSDDTATLRGQSYGLAVCTLWGGRLRAGPCANVALMYSEAESRGVVNPSTPKDMFWASASLGGQVAVELVSHLELLAEAGLQLPISRRPSFSFGENRQTVFDAPTLGYYGRLGLRFRWSLPPLRARARERATVGAKQ